MTRPAFIPPRYRYELPRVIDSTMIACFRSCPQKFFLEFVLGLRPMGVSIDLHAGGCFAAGLEDIYKYLYQNEMHLERAFEYAYPRFMTTWGDFDIIKDTPKTWDRVWAAIEDYFTTYPPQTDHVQPYVFDGKPAFEFTFGIPLEPAMGPGGERGDRFPFHPSGEPFIYGGRFDGLCHWHGKPMPRDEKTTTSISHNWAQSWDLRSQFLGYVWACRQSGLDVDTVCVRGIGILKTKFHQVEAIKTYDDNRINIWYKQLRRDLWRMCRMYDEGYFDYNFAEACTSYGGCPFRDVCSSPSPENWFGNYRVAHWNPLQKNPIAIEGPLATP